jgi:hypothetical protein
VWVRLSPDEATVVGEAAARAGMSVGAWVGDTAVGRARAEVAGDEPGEAGGAVLSSWRELVAVLVALRAEVAAVRRVPVLEQVSAVPVGELPPDGDFVGVNRDGVVGILRRIDAVTAAVLGAALPRARRSSRVGRECSGSS